MKVAAIGNTLEKIFRCWIPSWPNLAARPNVAKPRTFERTPMLVFDGRKCELDGDSDGDGTVTRVVEG